MLNALFFILFGKCRKHLIAALGLEDKILSLDKFNSGTSPEYSYFYIFLAFAKLLAILLLLGAKPKALLSTAIASDLFFTPIRAVP